MMFLKIIDANVISIFDAYFPHLKDCFIVQKLTFDVGVIIASLVLLFIQFNNNIYAQV